MKKLVCVLLLVCMTACAAAESVDLSGMSFDELMAMQGKLAAEIMSRPEWKEVTVPAGTWIIGKDIPAGSYCVQSPNGTIHVAVWREGIGVYDNFGLIYNELVSPESPLGRIELQKGWIFDIGMPVVFTPPISLGF